MTQITIGKSDAGDVTLDVARLIASRLLITSTSGGGKSWLLRKALEELSATTQTIVIDPEGEFASLRELRDMILVGPDGDLPADPRSAGLLARRLMEKNVSAVIDIYELPPTKRREFVAKFCQSLVDLPKSLWRPCFVAIDEAHEFAPEGENYASSEAVSLLCSKGRKRGLCALLATQRLSKLSKDVAAELKVRCIGQTILDTDQKRAADFLGFPKTRWTDLRDLSQPGHEGEFFAVGPALNDRGVIRFRSGNVKTTHPKAGVGRKLEPPKPSKHIAAVLGELKDLPQQAEEEANSLAAARKRIAELERELKAKPAPAVDPAAVQRAVAKAVADRDAHWAGKFAAVRMNISRVTDQSQALFAALSGMKAAEDERSVALPERSAGVPPRSAALTPTKPITKPVNEKPAAAANTDYQPGKCERAILQVLSQFPDGCESGKLTLLSGYRWSGGFRNSLSALRSAGLIAGDNGGVMTITAAGEALGPFDPLPVGQALIRYWLNHNSISGCGKKILQALLDVPEGLTAAELCRDTGYEFSGGFRNALSELRTAGLIDGKNTGTMTLSQHLLEAAGV